MTVAASDESLKDGNHNDVAGWKLAISTGRLSSIYIQSGVTRVDSAPEEQSSTRCKLQSIIAWMAKIEKLIGRRATGTIEV